MAETQHGEGKAGKKKAFEMFHQAIDLPLN
jgi:hypothetical protein